MRLQRGVKVADLEPELARSVVRAVGSTDDIAPVAAKLSLTPGEAENLVTHLSEHGFIERLDRGLRLSLSGGALAMASFNRPITRVSAERLLKGVVERARIYDSDDRKPLKLTRIRVFGSYLNPEAQDLGDLDLTAELNDRIAGWSARPNALLGYAQSSGRHFRNIVEQLDWPRREVMLLLRSRNAYINVSDEDIDRFTSESRQIYPK